MAPLPVGKLPPDLLRELLGRSARPDPRLHLGPGIGLDCAVIDAGDRWLVAKSDPITFASAEIGWYAVHVNANDVATTGARPMWFLATILLPETGSEASLAEAVFGQIRSACDQVGAALVGGHTEITAGLTRPIVAGTMLGEAERGRLVTPRGALPGDRLLLTKGIPIEGASLLAREFGARLASLPAETIRRARDYLHAPGISVVREALRAAEAGGVHAMHDPTEGGLAGGLWELAEAAGVSLKVDHDAIPVLPEGRAICEALGLDPMATIASGALLLAAVPSSVARITAALAAEGIECAEIGEIVEGYGVAMRKAGAWELLPRPARDAVAALYNARLE